MLKSQRIKDFEPQRAQRKAKANGSFAEKNKAINPYN
jgi:hypothetical protein